MALDPILHGGKRPRSLDEVLTERTKIKALARKCEMARRLVAACEIDLARGLSDGERRDLLMDNTPWDSAEIAGIVAAMRNADDYLARVAPVERAGR